jgi:DNA-binding transcriptional MerR regulator
MGAKMEFFTSDVEKICGVKRNRLQVWLEKGWIVPSIEKASGHGSRNIFSEEDLYNILLFKQLVENGLSREAVAEIKVPLLELIEEYQKTVDKLKEYKKVLVSDTPVDQYVFFFRKRIKVVKISTTIPSPSFVGADDIIGINIANIYRKVQKKIKEIEE